MLLLALALLTACTGQLPAAPEARPSLPAGETALSVAPVATPTAGATLLAPQAPAASPLPPTVAATPPAPFDPGTGDIGATAERDAVFTLRQSATERQPVPWKQTAFLAMGDGVDVDRQGWAILRYKDLWTAEVLRGASLTVRKVAGDPQNLATEVRLRSGALFNRLDPAQVANLELVVEGDLARVVALNAQVAVVEEETTPLQWTIVLSPTGGVSSTVQVTVDGTPKALDPGEAIWAAPNGSLSSPIAVDLAAVEQWRQNQANGVEQPEIGEILLLPADLEANVCAQRPWLEPNQPFDLDGIAVTLAPESAYGPAMYTVEDCNGDGLMDIAMQNGSLRLDFRALPARVRAVDVPLVSRAGANGGFLAVLDPAAQELERQAPAGPAGQEQLLSLRSAPGYPYHYAELTLKDGCFLGVSLTPPEADGSPGAPRSPALETGPAPGAQCQLAEDVRKPPRTQLRTGPGAAYPSASVLVQRGEELAPLAQNPTGDWLLLRAPTGEQGWVPLSYLSCVEIRCLPIVKPPPPPDPTVTPVPTPTRPQPTQPPPVEDPTPTPTNTPEPM